jgi:hypothetical protein
VRGARRVVLAAAPAPVSMMPSSPRLASVLALLLALPLPAAAETLYKCVDAAGLTTIQMAPCAKGSKQVWARDSAPEPPPTPEQAAAAQARAEAQARARAEEQERLRAQAEAQRLAADAAKAAPVADAGAGATGVPPTPPPPDPCDEAKAFAAQVRGKPWLGLDPGQMQRLYGWVAQQCGSPGPGE